MDAIPPMPRVLTQPPAIYSPAVYECIRWGWSTDVNDPFKRTVWCITWREKK